MGPGGSGGAGWGALHIITECRMTNVLPTHQPDAPPGEESSGWAEGGGGGAAASPGSSVTSEGLGSPLPEHRPASGPPSDPRGKAGTSPALQEKTPGSQWTTGGMQQGRHGTQLARRERARACARPACCFSSVRPEQLPCPPWLLEQVALFPCADRGSPCPPLSAPYSTHKRPGFPESQATRRVRPVACVSASPSDLGLSRGPSGDAGPPCTSSNTPLPRSPSSGVFFCRGDGQVPPESDREGHKRHTSTVGHAA